MCKACWWMLAMCEVCRTETWHNLPVESAGQGDWADVRYLEKTGVGPTKHVRDFQRVNTTRGIKQPPPKKKTWWSWFQTCWLSGAASPISCPFVQIWSKRTILYCPSSNATPGFTTSLLSSEAVLFKTPLEPSFPESLRTRAWAKSR